MVWEENQVAEDSLAAQCLHHWDIEPADGPISEGVCQKCGEVKKFTNYLERHDWSNSGNLSMTPTPAREFQQSWPEGQAEDETDEAS